MTMKYVQATTTPSHMNRLIGFCPNPKCGLPVYANQDHLVMNSKTGYVMHPECYVDAKGEVIEVSV